MSDAELPDRPQWADDLVEAAARAGEEVQDALRIALAAGNALPPPGSGKTIQRWAVLSALARANLTVGRIVEAHSDALAILDEAGFELQQGTWGVFAAEAPQHRLDAVVDGSGAATLDGVKPWCSLAGTLDRALVTAHLGDGRQLFMVDLTHPTVRAGAADGWVARGLRAVTSGPVHFGGTPARPVGQPGWYLQRAGFAWGGMGVAACWHGAALGLADTLRRTALRRDGELNALHVGAVDAALHGSAAVLAGAATAIDEGRADGAAGALLALRVRAVVADCAERVLHQVGHALGPAALAFDAAHAARTADLQLYVRQHHGERDLAELGRSVLLES